MTNHPAVQPVTGEVDLQVKTPEQRTPALLSNATGDVSPGQLVLATDGDDVLPAIVDQTDATAGTMLLSVLWDTEPPAADPGTENLRLSALPPDVREKALRSCSVPRTIETRACEASWTSCGGTPPSANDTRWPVSTRLPWLLAPARTERTV